MVNVLVSLNHSGAEPQSVMFHPNEQQKGDAAQISRVTRSQANVLPTKERVHSTHHQQDLQAGTSQIGYVQ